MPPHARRLKFLDAVLSDRPALTPKESFYQRILADDSNERIHSSRKNELRRRHQLRQQRRRRIERRA